MRSTFARLSWAAPLLALLAVSSRPIAANGSLFEALRRDDVAAVKALVKAGADVAAADDTGATPLMYAALYSGPAAIGMLLDHGADANAANRFGATALMWAARRAANVKTLLDYGADVNACARDGSTPLVVAARLGNADAMRMLIAAGADVKAQETRTNLLTAAYFSVNPAVRDVLNSANVVVASAADVKGPVLNRNRGDIDSLQALLHAGVNPKEEVPLITLALPSFFMAARDGQVDAMRAFIAAGADPNYKGARGWTALMLAAGSDTATIPALKFLLERGADVNATDADGRTALDWALTRGDTDIAKFLRSVGGTSHADAPAPLPPQVTTPRSAREAIELAVARLQPAGPAFSNRTKCNSCHNQNIPGLAIGLAKSRSLKVDEALASHSLTFTEQRFRDRREAILLGDTNGGGFQPNVEYSLLERAELRAAPSTITDAMVLGIAARQASDGSWPIGADIRPPLTASAVVGTALVIRAMRDFAPAAYRSQMDERIARARDYLRSVTPRDTQDQAFKLLGLIWSGAQAGEIDKEKSALMALQRQDGGWGQWPTMASDAYATGQALYALHGANMAATEPAYRKGADYLLRTQLEDGTWFVRTRAFGFQPYFETGFPHGRSQFISTVATSWASIALTYALQ